jgi:hypothetical protein
MSTEEYDHEEITHCSLCDETFAPDASLIRTSQYNDPAARVPVNSSKCSHYFCLVCIRRRRDTISRARLGGRTENSASRRKWIACPTCSADKAFNVDVPIASRCTINAMAALADAKRANGGETSSSHPVTTNTAQSRTAVGNGAEAKKRQRESDPSNEQLGKLVKPNPVEYYKKRPMSDIFTYFDPRKDQDPLGRFVVKRAKHLENDLVSIIVRIALKCSVD